MSDIFRLAEQLRDHDHEHPEEHLDCSRCLYLSRRWIERSLGPPFFETLARETAKIRAVRNN